MIKSFAAVTREIDDPKAAVEEILAALDLAGNLMKNAVGIVSCFSEFIDTGVVEAVCGALPFDCIGATTCLNAAGGETDQILFSIIVLTSDDCSFESLIIPIEEPYREDIGRALGGLLGRPAGRPALFLSYFPLINEVSGDMMLEAIDRATGGIPLFGTTAVDHLPDYATSQTICNGKAYRKTLVLGAVYGDVTMDFGVASLDGSKIRNQKAIITSSDGNLLIGVNGNTALEYLEEIGLSREVLSKGLGFIPFVVDHRAGTLPVARAIFALTPEGYVVCGGAMPVNGTLGIGSMDREDVLRTTQTVLKPLAEKGATILGYSCVARYLILGARNKAEADAFMEIAGGAPYLYAYSGGEICPLPDANGRLRNMYHNFTGVFCRLG